MVEGGGFEPPKAEPADLQSAPFDRSGIPPSGKPIIIVTYKFTSQPLKAANTHFFAQTLRINERVFDSGTTVCVRIEDC